MARKIDALSLVVDALTEWLASKKMLRNGRLNWGWTLADPPNEGYGIDMDLAYPELCDFLEEKLSSRSGRKLKLNKTWRDDRKEDDVTTFISKVRTALLDAKESAQLIAARKRINDRV